MSQLENLTKEESNIINRLLEKLPDRAIQRTKKENTKKAYDTDGYGYMFCVNRFNETLGNKWGYDYKILKESSGTYKSGTSYFDITVEVSIWILSPENGRICFGGHISSVYADALKGAFTNAFKKTAAMWGVGRHAYEGTLDDDNEPPEKETEKRQTGQVNKPKEQEKKVSPKETEQKLKQEPKPIEKKEVVGNETKNEKDNGNANRKDVGKDNSNENISEIGEVTAKTFQEIHKRDPLIFEQLKDKMDISKNMYELNARCKKYRPDYDLMDKEQQLFIRVARDKRKVWLTRGEGVYTDLDTKGVDKDYKENK